ncbi:MAG: SRPBCC family protein [Acidobacteriota bacterium]
MAQHDALAFWLPAPRDAVFDFFADARNLNTMTPPWLAFHIVDPTPPISMAVGTRITYRMRWRGLPLPWQSEIVDWRPNDVFTYAMRRGPYRSWVHEHIFETRDDGTYVLDRVTWSIWLAPLLEPLVGRWVARDVRRIFAHRAEAMIERFGGGHVLSTPEATSS